MARFWLGECCARKVWTVLIKAADRKEAEMKLRNRTEWQGDIYNLEDHYTTMSLGRIIREDK